MFQIKNLIKYIENAVQNLGGLNILVNNPSGFGEAMMKMDGRWE